jgi:hypothetical protein
VVRRVPRLDGAQPRQRAAHSSQRRRRFAQRALVSRVENLESRSTAFNDARVWRDDLQLGRCALDELPAYFARAAERLAIEWSWDEAGLQSSLRGRKRAAVLSWLRGSRR